MENKQLNLEPLFEKAESYAKTSFMLYKLKTIEKTAKISATVVSRGVAIIFLFFFIATANIGVSLWIGELLGKAYYGFFCVAVFYGVTWIIVRFFMQNCIKKRVSHSVASQLLN